MKLQQRKPVLIPKAHIKYMCVVGSKFVDACESRTTRGMCFCQRVKFVRGVRVRK